jgi:glycosyltransferase involved in cell wall biosynthesis
MKRRVLVFTSQTDLPEASLYCGIHERGWDVKVYCNSTARHIYLLQAAGIEVKYLDYPSRLSPTLIKQMRVAIKEYRPLIIHYFNSRALSNGLLASWNLPVKQVAYRGTVGHLSHWDPTSWFSFLNPRLDKIIAVSGAVEEYLLGLGISRSRVQKIYKGHDPSWYDEPVVDLAQFGIPADAFVVCCAANVRPVKGVDYLLNAFKLLDPALPIHLLLIGEVRDKKVKKLLHELTPNKRIHAIGFRRDVSGIIAASDVFVMCSVSREGLAKAAIEAMCRSVATVVTNVGGLPELVLNERSGLVVPPRDAAALATAFSRLYQDKDLRERLGHGGRSRVEEAFHINNTVNETVKLYEELSEDNLVLGKS